jgi:hypothetical protein
MPRERIVCPVDPEACTNSGTSNPWKRALMGGTGLGCFRLDAAMCKAVESRARC